MILSINIVSNATKPDLMGQNLIAMRVFHCNGGKDEALLTGCSGPCLYHTKQVGFLTVQLTEGRTATYDILAVVTDIS
jgi:hypothetical protein